MAQGLVGSIFAAYSDLGRAQLHQEETANEPRILFYAFLSGFLLFLVGLPTVKMQATLIDDSSAVAIVLTARFFGALFVLPLLFYALAAIARLVAAAFGGTGSFRNTRLSIFWAVLVTMPILIFASLSATILASATELPLSALGVLVLLGFAVIWGKGLAATEGFARTWPACFVIAALPIFTFFAIAGIQQ